MGSKILYMLPALVLAFLALVCLRLLVAIFAHYGGYDSVWYMGSDPYLIPLNVERFYATQPDNHIGSVSAIGNEQANTFYTGYTSGNFRGEGGDDIFNGGGWVEAVQVPGPPPRRDHHVGRDQRLPD